MDKLTYFTGQKQLQLCFYLKFHPRWWIALSDSSTITTDGTEYPQTAIEGISTNERIFMPDSGIIRFVMTFPAIPAETKNIDFSENTKSSWQIHGIDLTGKVNHHINWDKVSARLRSSQTNAMLPKPVVTFGDSTTVNIHLLGYHPEAEDQILLFAMLYIVWLKTAPHSLLTQQVKLPLKSPFRHPLIIIDYYQNNLLAETILSPEKHILPVGGIK